MFVPAFILNVCASLHSAQIARASTRNKDQTYLKARNIPCDHAAKFPEIQLTLPPMRIRSLRGEINSALGMSPDPPNRAYHPTAIRSSSRAVLHPSVSAQVKQIQNIKAGQRDKPPCNVGVSKAENP